MEVFMLKEKTTNLEFSTLWKLSLRSEKGRPSQTNSLEEFVASRPGLQEMLEEKVI